MQAFLLAAPVASSKGPSGLDWITTLAAVGAFLTAAAIPATAFFRRPSLKLREDKERVHSAVEGDGLPYVRLVVTNRRLRRVAREARVFVGRYRENGAGHVARALGSPELGWTSLFGAHGIVLPGGERPVDFGILYPGYTDVYGRFASTYPDQSAEVVIQNTGEWWFKFALDQGLALADRREFLPPRPSGYSIWLDLGAEDGPARRYDVHLNWDGKAKNAEAALQSVSLEVLSRSRPA